MIDNDGFFRFVFKCKKKKKKDYLMTVVSFLKYCQISMYRKS